MKIDVKSPLYIDYSEGLNEELVFKHKIFIFRQGVLLLNLLSLVNLRTSLNVFRLYLFIVTLLAINLYAPLLRTILVNENYGKYKDHIFSKPHYIPVSVNTIDTRDDTGEPIHFEAGKILVKLHFKPKQYG
jgi:hypothetical protein